MCLSGAGSVKKQIIMTKAQLKTQIEKLAAETNSTFVEAASALQAQAAKKKDEYLITAIHTLKMENLGL